MVYYIENESFKVGVKAHGAELTSVISKKSGREFIWQGNKEIWSGQSPVLFPIIGRVLDDKYRLDGKEYSMPKHGFFRDRESSLVQKTDDSLTFVQTHDEKTLEIFPYRFEFFVTFKLDSDSLMVTYKVVNHNDKTMYFSVGGHPAFNCQIGDDITFGENETLSTVAIDSQCLRTDKQIPVLSNEKKIVITNDIFNNDALIFNSMRSHTLTINSQSLGKIVEFDFTDAPYLGIWAKPGAPYVCIEPWWGVNDDHTKRADFSEKDAIMSAQANGSFSCCWSARFFS